MSSKETEPTVLGTCFAFRYPATFLTARHLFRRVSPQELAIGFLTTPGLRPVVEVHAHPSADLAVLKTADVSTAGIEPFWDVVNNLSIGEEYVVELVAPNVVNAMPEATLDALADHGQIRGNTIAGTYRDAQAVLDDLDNIGISYDEVIELLEVEGVQKFEDSYAQLASAISMQLTGCIA